MKTVVQYRPVDVVSALDDWDALMKGFFGEDVPRSSREPKVDIVESGESFVLEAELPGLTEQDVEIKIQDRVLSLQSVDKDAAESSGKQWLLRERKRFSFKRSFTLPRNVAVEEISAVFKNGLLTITLPISPEAKERVISIRKP